jgi:hypothetical protein
VILDLKMVIMSEKRQSVEIEYAFGCFHGRAREGQGISGTG